MPPKTKKTKATPKKAAKKPATRKAIRETDPDEPALRTKLTLAQFRKLYPQTAPNRYRVEKTDQPLTLVLEGGSTVTKGRNATLVVEDAGRIGKYRVTVESI
jgi:hypothetical protein